MGVLTEKEQIVVDDLAHGFHRREIAERQFRSEAVIKKHIANAKEKLRARTCAHLVILARELGLIGLLLAVIVSNFNDVGGDMRKGRLTRSFSVRGGRVMRDVV